METGSELTEYWLVIVVEVVRLDEIVRTFGEVRQPEVGSTWIDTGTDVTHCRLTSQEQEQE